MIPQTVIGSRPKVIPGARIVTTVAAWQKITSPDPQLGFFAGAADLAGKLASGALPAARAAVAPQLIFNQQLDGWLTIVFSVIVWLVIGDMLRVAIRTTRGLPTLASSEAPRVVRFPAAGGGS